MDMAIIQTMDIILGKTQNSANINDVVSQGGVSQIPNNGATNPVLKTYKQPQVAPNRTYNTASNTASNTANIVQSTNSVSKSIPQNYTLQVGNYTNANTANQIASSLKSQGFDAQVVKVGSTNKIVVGDYATKVAGESTKANLKALGYAGIFFTQLGE